MKLLAFTIGLIIPFVALFLGLQVSPTLGSFLLTPIILLSSFFDEAFANLPFYIHALLIFSSGIFYFLLFYFFSRLFFKKLS